MSLTLAEAPEVSLISIEEARLHLRLDAVNGVHPDDLRAKLLIKAAMAEIDGRDGWLGRALVTQSWQLNLDSFDCGPYAPRIRIPLPPLQTVDTIRYTSTAGVDTLLASSAYRVVTDATPGYVEPVYGTSWPATRDQGEAVRIAFTAGYGAAAADVPAAIKAYALLKLQALYDIRDLPDWVANMIDSFRVRTPYP